MRMTVREVRLLKAVRHANCVELLDAFKSNSGRVYLVFEYVPSTAYRALANSVAGCPPKTLKLIAWQMLRALTYLHDNKMIHRDIKPANILMDPDTYVAKLCDFGFARMTDCGPRDVQRCTSYVVTRWYRAPEVLVSDEYGPSSDIWSFGCLMAELATRRPLFQGTSTVDQLWRIMRCCGPLTPRQTELMCSDARLQTLVGLMPSAPIKPLRVRLPEVEPRLLELVGMCLALNPAARPTARDLLRLPYFWDLPRYIAGHPQLDAWYREDQAALAAEAASAAAAAARLKAAQAATQAATQAAAQAAAQPAAAAAAPSGSAAAAAGVAVGVAAAAVGGGAKAAAAGGAGAGAVRSSGGQSSMVMALNQAAVAAARAAKAASLKHAAAAVAAADAFAAAPPLQQEQQAPAAPGAGCQAPSAAPDCDPMDVSPAASSGRGHSADAVDAAGQQLSSGGGRNQDQRQHAAKRARAEAAADPVVGRAAAGGSTAAEAAAAAISPVTAANPSKQRLPHMPHGEDQIGSDQQQRQQQQHQQQAEAQAAADCAVDAAAAGSSGSDRRQASSFLGMETADFMNTTAMETTTQPMPAGMLTGLVTPGMSGPQQPVATARNFSSNGGLNLLLHGGAAAVGGGGATSGDGAAAGGGQRISRRNPSMVLLQTQNSMMLMAGEFDNAATPVGAPPPCQQQDGPLPHERPGVTALVTTSGAQPQAATVGGARIKGVRRNVTCIALGNEGQGLAAEASAAAGGRAHARAAAMDGAASAAAHGGGSGVAVKNIVAGGGAGVHGATVSGGIAPRVAPPQLAMRPAPQPHSHTQQSQHHAQASHHPLASHASTGHTAGAAATAELHPAFMRTRAAAAANHTADGAVAAPARNALTGVVSLPAGCAVSANGGGRGSIGMLLEHLSYDAAYAHNGYGIPGSMSGPVPQDTAAGSQQQQHQVQAAGSDQRRFATQYGMLSAQAHATAQDFDAASTSSEAAGRAAAGHSTGYGSGAASTGAGAGTAGLRRSVEGMLQQQTAGGRLFDSSALTRGSHRSLPRRGPSRLSQIGMRPDSPSAAAAAASGEGSNSPSMGLGLTPTSSGQYPAGAAAAMYANNNSAWAALSSGAGVDTGAVDAYGFPANLPSPTLLPHTPTSVDLNNHSGALSAMADVTGMPGTPFSSRNAAAAVCDGGSGGGGGGGGGRLLMVPVAPLSNGPVVASPASRLRRRTVTGDIVSTVSVNSGQVDAPTSAAGTPRAASTRAHRSVDVPFVMSATSGGSPRVPIAATAAAAVAVAAAGGEPPRGISVANRGSTASGIGIIMETGCSVSSPRALPMVSVDSVGSPAPSFSAAAHVGGSQKSMRVTAPAAPAAGGNSERVSPGYRTDPLQQGMDGQRGNSASGGAVFPEAAAAATAPAISQPATGGTSSVGSNINKLVQAFKRVVGKF
ncbi:hypothetical protein HXX76_006747 [Chlamydomonas incerta]|uniref:Protein kinase domain-containing protein n=1 Tax=Chlamydomonas incerta TaxID=51695 RepID=A0A835T9V8_CHLIN|nr:hypothetical protein HXX76_006747 [Chlamydomonas incerta]|eukprot:KAG2436444.1 hypothetical protein HXX76_006747 [Chlamydomonas incerta]